MIVAQGGFKCTNATLLGVESGPERPVGEQIALSIVEVAATVWSRDEQRLVDHAAVHRHWPISVAAVAQQAQFGGDAFEIVAHQRPNVEHKKPAVAIQAVARVVGGHVLRIELPRIRGADVRDVGDVERTIVREIQMHLAHLVRVGLGVSAKLQDFRGMRHGLLPLIRAHLAPPDVHLLVSVRGGIRGAASVLIKQDAKVCFERVGGVCGIPDGNEVARCGRHSLRARCVSSDAPITHLRVQFKCLGTCDGSG